LCWRHHFAVLLFRLLYNIVEPCTVTLLVFLVAVVGIMMVLIAAAVGVKKSDAVNALFDTFLS
jgi:hypothetical protein